MRRGATSRSGRARRRAGLSPGASREQLYLGETEWQRGAARAAAGRAAVAFRRARRAMAGASSMPAAGRRAISPPERADPKVKLFDAVRDYLEAEQQVRAQRTAIAAFSEGSAERLADRAARARRRPTAPRRRRPRRSRALPRSAVGLAVLPLEQGFATDELVVLGEQDILGDRLARPPRQRRKLDQFLAEATNFDAGRSRRPCRSRHRPLRGAGDARCRRRAA